MSVSIGERRVARLPARMRLINANMVRRNELEQILWHCDTAEKAGETPRLHSVLVDSKVQILEGRNKTLKHELERTQMLEEAARRKLDDVLGQSQPYSYHGLGQRSSRKEQSDTYEPHPHRQIVVTFPDFARGPN